MTLEKSLYQSMVRLRMVEEKIVQIYPEKEIRSPVHLYIGHEAVAAGVCATLQREDHVVPYYRSHGWYLAKGGNLQALMDELFGRATGCSGGWGGSMHLIDVEAGVMGSSAIVSGGVSHAVGSALAVKMLGRPLVTVAVFGDGAIEEGPFHESLNFASLKKLPVIFVCENNFYAVHSPLRERQPRPDIHLHAAPYAVPGVVVDGNDVLEVYQAAAAAAARARDGQGPTLLECRTYRWLEHCGSNDDSPLGYRSIEEIREWMGRCPIARARHLVTADEDGRIRERIAQEIEAAVARARTQSWPMPTWTPASYEI